MIGILLVDFFTRYIPRIIATNAIITLSVIISPKKIDAKFLRAELNKMKENGIMTSQVHNRNDVNSCVISFKEKLLWIQELEEFIISKTMEKSDLSNAIKSSLQLIKQ